MTGKNDSLAGKLVAFFHQSADMYGSDKILLSLAKSVQHSGGNPVVLIPCAGPLCAELEINKIEFHVLPVMKLSRATFSLKGIFNLALEFFRAVDVYDAVFEGRRVDMVHSNTVAVLGGAVWARRRGVPHLWHVHEIVEHPRFAAKIFPWLLKIGADRVVCNSKATYQWLIGEQPELTSKMGVIWNGIEGPEQSVTKDGSGLYCNFRPNGAKIAIGLVGRINRLKGHLLLLEAAEVLRGKGVKDFSVVFVGSPPPGQEHFEQDLKARIAVSPVCDAVVLQGFMHDIWSAYAALEIVCVPSTEAESFGLVAVEAMAAGRPVVASRLGGLTEVVVDKVTGLLFTPRDVGALSCALEELISDASQRRKMGAAGRERFKTIFSLDNMLQLFMVAYCKLIVNKS